MLQAKRAITSAVGTNIISTILRTSAIPIFGLQLWSFSTVPISRWNSAPAADRTKTPDEVSAFQPKVLHLSHWTDFTISASQRSPANGSPRLYPGPGFAADSTRRHGLGYCATLATRGKLKDLKSPPARRAVHSFPSRVSGNVLPGAASPPRCHR
jgi:hypothetical protein